MSPAIFANKYCYSTWLVTSRLDTTRHVRRVEPMHFGRVEIVDQHGSTRDVTSQVEFFLMQLCSPAKRSHGMGCALLRDDVKHFLPRNVGKQVR